MKLLVKTHRIFFLVSLVLILTSLVLFTESRSKPLSAQGAESARQLSSVLFYAVKYNSFPQLNFYIPDGDKLQLLKNNSTNENRLFFESLNSSELLASLQVGFDKITREGIENNINWASAELVDYKTRTCNLKIDGCNVTYTIEDQNMNQIVISYDAIRIDGQWYLFQNLNLGNIQEGVSSSN
jgi:hypothetical protein